MKFEKYMANKKPKKLSLNENGSYAINEEESIGDSFLKFFQGMRAYATLSSKWPTLYQDKLDSETETAVGLAEFDLKAAELAVTKEEKRAVAIKAAKEKMPREKRAEFTQKMADQEKADKAKVTEQIKAKRTAYEKQMQAKTNEIGTDIDDLISENPIASDLLKKQWGAEKIQQTLDMDAAAALDKIDQLHSANAEVYSDEKLASMKAKAKEKAAAERKEKEDTIAALEQEAEDEQAALDDKLATANDDQKEAIGKLKTFQSDLKTYIGKAKAAKAATDESYSVDYHLNASVFEEDEAPANDPKAEALTAQKKVTASLNSVTSSVVKKGLGVDPEKADEIVNNFKAQLADAKKEFKVRDTDKVDTGLDDEDEESTAAKPAAKEAPKPDATDNTSDTDTDTDNDEEQTPPDNTEKKKRAQRKVDLTQRQLDKATSQEKKDEWQAKLDKAKKELADLGESVEDYGAKLSTILEELDAIANEISAATSAPTSKIMNFSDFMAKKSK